VTPAGPAAAVTTPQAQRRESSRHSTTRTVIVEMLNTCRRMILAGGSSATSRPLQPTKGVQLVHDHFIGDGDLPQRAPLPTRLTTRFAPGPAPQRLRRRLVQPVARRRFRRVAREGGQLPLQLRAGVSCWAIRLSSAVIRV